ncbi:two-component sensor histidine kinase [Paenibacillus flagellatus]|uniref:histidine kinase n=1 Tax=Paenibacillus flagellatus TaxID=2211139 RepID=A0A2V5K2Z3_9BACL|nr:two-component sensor histidine kinase [Paenibacillus flagellatus]
MRTKIVSIFILLITLPFAIQSYVAYHDFSSVVKRKTADYTLRIADQINKHLDTTFTEMQRLSLMPLYDQEVVAVLKKHGEARPDSLPSVRNMEKMSSYIHGILFNRPELKSIQIMTNDGYAFTNMDPSLVKLPDRFREESWYRKTAAADGAGVLIARHTPSYMPDGGGEDVVSFARLLREPYTNRALGIIKMDLKLSLFDRILSNWDVEEYGTIVVVNGDNEPFFEKRIDPGVPLPPLPDFGAEAASRRLDIGSDRYYAFADRSSATGLRVISVVPVDTILKESKRMRAFITGIGLFCLAAACGLAMFFSYRLSKPLIELRRKMFRVQLGNFRESLPAESKDEIGQLNASFNRMVEEINRLVNEVYVIGLREKEAELAALLSRINPHFIYNTLESINMMAVRRGNEDVSDMVTALGTLLRHSIDKYDRMIPLDRELESIRSYVRIQQMRYGDRLRVVYDIDDRLGNVAVPKLLLQPLVENAIYHGIGDGSGTIWIAVARFERELLLIVRDDGCGMDEAAIERLKRSMSRPPTFESGEGGGMALANIYQRIRLLYGDGADLDIDGSPGAGASFTITLPIGEGEERDDGDV